jgi:hypothetical protein
MYQRMTSKEKVRQRVLVALTVDRKLICTFHGDSPRRTTNTYERAAG